MRLGRGYDKEEPWFDTMQVCLSGHKITAMAIAHPENRVDRCPKCGAATILACPACSAAIPGYKHSPIVVSADQTKPPDFCVKCGKPFPWKSDSVGSPGPDPGTNATEERRGQVSAARVRGDAAKEAKTSTDGERLVAELDGLVEEGRTLKVKHGWNGSELYSWPADDVCLRWRTRALGLIRTLCGETSDHYRDLRIFADGTNTTGVGQFFVAWLGIVEAAADDVHRGCTAQTESLPSSSPGENERAAPSAVQRVTKLIDRFPSVAKAMEKRHAKREPFFLKDEYDVQYLLQALLNVEFDDVRPEEPTPSVGGGSARMDFLLKVEGLAIETKMTREGLSAKDIRDELLVDIGTYRQHPDASTLVCFVYDPTGIIGNRVGFESDMSGQSTEKLGVIALVRPKR